MLYDYKSKEIVQDVVLDCLAELIEDIKKEYNALRRYEYLTICVPSNMGAVLSNILLEEIDDLNIDEDCDFDSLNKEDENVLISLNCDGILFIENMKFDNGNLKPCDGVLNYVYDGFSSKTIEKLSKDFDSILVFGFAEDENNESDNLCQDEHGFTISRSDDYGYSSYSFYSTDKTLVDQMLKNFKLDY